MFSGKIKISIVIFTLTASVCFAQGTAVPGIFTREGFGARAMGMSNAMTGVRAGELSGFYNPAVLPFTTGRTVSFSTSLMSLDRHLNSLFYAQQIDPEIKVVGQAQSVEPVLWLMLKPDTMMGLADSKTGVPNWRRPGTGNNSRDATRQVSHNSDASVG